MQWLILDPGHLAPAAHLSSSPTPLQSKLSALGSGPVMFWWRNSQWPGLGWRSSDVGRSLGDSLVREGFLEEEGLRGQVMSDSVMLTARPWCLDASV